MIKPNTLCMIRGVPATAPGGDCNGKIVQAKELVSECLWRFEPAVESCYNHTLWKIDLSDAQYLHPLDDFEDELAHEALDEVLQTTFRTALERALEKL